MFLLQLSLCAHCALWFTATRRRGVRSWLKIEKQHFWWDSDCFGSCLGLRIDKENVERFGRARGPKKDLINIFVREKCCLGPGQWPSRSLVRSSTVDLLDVTLVYVDVDMRSAKCKLRRRKKMMLTYPTPVPTVGQLHWGNICVQTASLVQSQHGLVQQVLSLISWIPPTGVFISSSSTLWLQGCLLFLQFSNAPFVATNSNLHDSLLYKFNSASCGA